MSGQLGSDLDRLGFSIVRGVLSPEIVVPLRADLRKITAANGTTFGDLPDAHCWLPAVSTLLGSDDFTGLVAAACGQGASLRLCKASVTTSDHPPLALHADSTVWMEPPFPVDAVLVTLLIALDAVDRDGGCTTIVVGSHRIGAEPTATEAQTASATDTELGAGDVLVWRGATWHGRRRRVIAGERVVLVAAYGSPKVPSTTRT